MHLWRLPEEGCLVRCLCSCRFDRRLIYPLHRPPIVPPAICRERDRPRSHVRATLRLTRRRLGWAILYAIAAVYFTVDLAFLSFIRPLRRRLLGGGRIHGWIDGLNRYAALSLVLVPLAILEPVKPLGFYLTAKGHLATGGSLIAMGEIVKVTLVEQVIEVTKPNSELSLVRFDVQPLGSNVGPAALDQGMAVDQVANAKHTFARVRQMKVDMDGR